MKISKLSIIFTSQLGKTLGEYGQIAWSDEMEICSDAVYKELSQKQFSHA